MVILLGHYRSVRGILEVQFRGVVWDWQMEKLEKFLTCYIHQAHGRTCHSHGNIIIQSPNLLQQGERRVFFFSSMEKDNFLGWKAAWITILFAHNLRRRRRRSTAVSWCFLHKGLGDDADHSLSHRKCSSKLRINMLNPTLGR